MTTTWSRYRLAAVAVAAVVAACKSDRGDSGERKAAPPVVAADLPAELARWMPPGAARSWEGAWLSRLQIFEGARDADDEGLTALEFRGTDATLFDGERDRALGFAIVAPCLAEFTETSAETRSVSGRPVEITGTVSTEIEFVIIAGTLQAGNGWAGYRDGGAAIVCRNRSAQGGVYTLDEAGACAEWVQPSPPSAWQKRPASCGWSVQDGVDVLTIKENDRDVVLVAAGDALMDDMFRTSIETTPLVRVKDLATAKDAMPLKGLGADPRRVQPPRLPD